MRRLTGSTSSTTTSTSCVVERILPGWTFFLVQLISETVDQAFDARLQFHERTVIGDVRDDAGDLLAKRVLCRQCLPRGRLPAASCPARCGCVSWLMRMIWILTV